MVISIYTHGRSKFAFENGITTFIKRMVQKQICMKTGIRQNSTNKTVPAEYKIFLLEK